MRVEGRLVLDGTGVIANFREAEDAQEYLQLRQRIRKMEQAIEEALETLPKTYLLTGRTLKAALDK